jgi:hypothetical protein
MSADKRFWWFEGATVAALSAQLMDAGPAARLEVHIAGEEMTLHVIQPGDHAALKPLNDSFVCPPNCPH